MTRDRPAPPPSARDRTRAGRAADAPRRLAALSGTLVEVPLAALSFLAHRAVRTTLRALVAVHFRLGSGRKLRWRVTSSAYLRQPLVLPVVMTEGPRWNTHAITASVGPIRVQHYLRIDLDVARQSATHWTFVIYRYPGYRTFGALGSGDPSDNRPDGTVALPPGQYTVVLRYYNWRSRVELPAITADGVGAIEPVEVPPDVNECLLSMARDRSFYLALHYYVWVMLKYRDRLPGAWVEREFLPVGNPETRFAYGILQPGQSLQLEIDPRLLSTCSVYLTLYCRASFPTAWCEVADRTYTTPPSPIKAFYLVRIHPRRGGVPGWEDLIVIQLK